MSPVTLGAFGICSALLSLAAGTLQAQAAGSASMVSESAPPHVRCLDNRAERLLADALNRSATVRELVVRLGASDVIVYVTTAAPLVRASHMPRGNTTFLSATPSDRYLQVWVDLRRPEAERTAVLGHEFQHALEFAAHVDARDAVAFVRVFERLGAESGSGPARVGSRQFETAPARNVEARVFAEVAHNRR